LPYAELGLAYTQKGMHEEAIAELQKGFDVSMGHPRIRGMLGYAYAAAGKRAEAQKVLEKLTSAPERRFGDAAAMARVHAGLGETDQAFDWLQEACDERDSLVKWLSVDPTFDDLHSDPRFAELLKQIGLPQ
jgi:Flp pilus assembly protein TadD